MTLAKEMNKGESRCNIISHIASGGITNGEWAYQSDIQLEKFDQSVKRQLGLILRPLHSGTALSQIGIASEREERVYEEDSIVDFGETSILVNAPCVFVKNEKVRRRLEMEEIYDVYDLDRNTQREISSLHSSMKVRPSYAFARQIPVKVLVRIGKAVLQGIWGTEISNDKNNDKPKRGFDTSIKHKISRELKEEKVLEKMEIAELQDGSECVERKEVEPKNASQEKEEGGNILENIKAAKNDDAKANENDWNLWCVDQFDKRELKNGKEPLICKKGSFSPLKHGRLFDALRILAHRRYCRNLLKSLLRHLHKEHSRGETVLEEITWRDPSTGARVTSTTKVSSWTTILNSKERSKGNRPSRKQKDKLNPTEHLYKDWNVGSDAVRRGVNSTWWEWTDGSTLNFWRWPRCYWGAVRDGTRLFVDKNKLPKYKKPQTVTKDPRARDQVEKKINKVRRRRYIKLGLVKSITAYFDVPKGDDDICMVYDATKCGLNAALWTPNFFLPTIDTILRNADDTTWFGDIDLGEMFLNYWINEELRPYVGVDVTSMGERAEDKFGNITFVHEGRTGKIWERWERTLMGFQSSPYICTQMFSWSEDCLRGDRKDIGNPLRWDDVRLNLPRSPDYEPGKWLVTLVPILMT